MTDHPLTPGDTLSHFRLLSGEPLPEIDGRAWRLDHEPTGLRLLWLANDDQERAFSITFKTPPANDTGVFHILEHSVLDGSAKYPVREPFVELLKTSMATFLNALTFPDKTMYPVSSTNVDDLEHLMDVYLDAVFHPNLLDNPNIFRQEGWHLELADVEGPLTRNGVVLNEMKGALADPDDVLFLEVERALFPDVAYRYESGGDPRAIPELTYDEFRDTHRRHYQPSNAYVVLYGDLDIERTLAFLDERIPRIAAEAALAPNPLDHQAPIGFVRAEASMATSPENAAVARASVVGDASDRTRILATDILLDAIAATNESPLKRAVIASGLGNDLAAYLVNDCAQPFCVLELKGAGSQSAEPFSELIDRTCHELVEQGIGRERLEASLAQVEFALREGDAGYPDGIRHAMASLASWLYDEDDPLAYVRYEESLAAIRAGIAAGYFERLLAAIVDSDHQCLVTLSTDAPSTADAEAAELAAIKASLSHEELEALVAQTEALHAAQATPDGREALERLPRLPVSALGEAPRPVAREVVAEPIPHTVYDLETHGIDYANYYFDLGHLAREDLFYASILSSVLGKLATARHSAEELDTLLAAKLGDLAIFCGTSAVGEDSEQARVYLACQVASLAPNLDAACALPAELWLETDFSDTERIRAILVQRRQGLEEAFISQGHSVAIARLGAQRSRAAACSQLLDGIDFYEGLVELLDDYDRRAPALSERLEHLARAIFVTSRLTLSLAGPSCERFWEMGPLDGVPSGEDGGDVLDVALPGPKVEAFGVPAGVDFCAKGALLSDVGAHYDGTWLVLGRAMSYSYLWNEVRVLGGAYGAGLNVLDSGRIGFYSFRDPAVDPTLARFDAAAQWLASEPFDAKDVDGYIVACVGGLDKPLKARTRMRSEDLATMGGHDVEWRTRLRDEVLSVTPASLHGLAEPLAALGATMGTCVVGQPELIAASSLDVPIVALGSGGER